MPDVNKRIAAEISWSRTHDRRARTQPGRDKFLERFEREVDPEGTLPPTERLKRAEHAKKAYMLDSQNAPLVRGGAPTEHRKGSTDAGWESLSDLHRSGTAVPVDGLAVLLPPNRSGLPVQSR